MHPDVQALLAVQEDDARIMEIERQVASLAPKLERLAREREQADRALGQARQALDGEERRRSDLETRLAHHRQLQERSQHQLNVITSPREAAAAMAQAEQTRRMVYDSERDLDTLDRRIAELRREAEEREAGLASVEQAQSEARATLDAERATLEEQLGTARADRERKANAAPRSQLAKYDRILSKRRVQVLYPLRSGSCSHCDTVIPVQRRSAMTGSGNLELCEGCGMLLYAAE